MDSQGKKSVGTRPQSGGTEMNGITRNKTLATLVVLAIAIFAVLAISGTAKGEETTGTYSYTFADALKVNLNPEWYDNTHVEMNDDCMRLYEKDNYDEWVNHNVKNGGWLLTIARTSDPKIFDVDGTTAIGFDETNRIYYYASVPIDEQSYKYDPELDGKYEKMAREARKVIDDVTIIEGSGIVPPSEAQVLEATNGFLFKHGIDWKATVHDGNVIVSRNGKDSLPYYRIRKIRTVREPKEMLAEEADRVFVRNGELMTERPESVQFPLKRGKVDGIIYERTTANGTGRIATAEYMFRKGDYVYDFTCEYASGSDVGTVEVDDSVFAAMMDAMNSFRADLKG